MSARRPSGFSLLDGAILVVVLALLASVAVPEFRARELRKRIGERDEMLAAIVQAAQALEPAPPAIVTGSWNPPVAPRGGKGAWVEGKDGWKRLPGVAPGSTWCSYQFVLDEERTPARLVVAADCDIDGDGVHAVTVRAFTRSGNGFVLAGETAPQPSTF